MNIDIRKSIINNFKDSNTEEIKEAIDGIISDHDEIGLPGLGVLFEINWQNSNEELKQTILKNIESNLKK